MPQKTHTSTNDVDRLFLPIRSAALKFADILLKFQSRAHSIYLAFSLHVGFCGLAKYLRSSYIRYRTLL
jgi:hypothetical protein